MTCGSEPARGNGVPANFDVTDPTLSRAGSLPQALLQAKKSGARCAAFNNLQISGDYPVHHDRPDRADHARHVDYHPNHPGHDRPSRPDLGKIDRPPAVVNDSSEGPVDSSAANNSVAPVGSTWAPNSSAAPSSNFRRRNRPAPVRCRLRNGNSSSLRRSKARMPKESNRETQ